MRKRILFTRSVACTITLCLIVTSMSFVTLTAGANFEPPILETTEEGARQFDEGIRDVESILTLDLSTERGVNQAAAILKRNEKKLANYEKKALQSVLRVEAFKKGLKDEAGKRKGGDAELATELESKPGSVGNIPGAEEAAEAIRRSTKPAADLLQRVADALQKAGDEAKKKHGQNGHHTSKTVILPPTLDRSGEPVNPALFCASYQAICDMLTRVGLYYLRRSVDAVLTGTAKAGCVVNAYVSYNGCIITHWWDTAYCVSRLASSVNICLRYS
jgi:hypothetical protein